MACLSISTLITRQHCLPYRNIVTSRIVRESYCSLTRLASNSNNVIVHWVPDYTGILGNELADSLARKGLFTPFIRPKLAIGISKDCKLRTTVFKILRGQHYEEWLDSNGLL